jgi:hypothetical protein
MRSTRDLKDMVGGARNSAVGNKKGSILDDIPDIEGTEKS